MAEQEMSDNDRMKMLFAEDGLVNGSRKTKVVSVDCTDINEGYIGKFKFHYPSLVERVKMGTDQANMLNGLPRESIDNMTNDIAYASSILMNVIDYCPDWFKLNQIGDPEVLFRVFKAYADWVDSFRQQPKQIDVKENSSKSTTKEVHVDNEKVEGTSN